jgi:hypothetical protein
MLTIIIYYSKKDTRFQRLGSSQFYTGRDPKGSKNQRDLFATKMASISDREIQLRAVVCSRNEDEN